MKRTPLKRRSVSNKWAEWVKANPIGMYTCHLCTFQATEWHHRGQRSTHPEHVTSDVNLIPVCRQCHRRIHTMDDPYTKGLILRSWVVPGSEDDPWMR